MRKKMGELFEKRKLRIVNKETGRVLNQRAPLALQDKNFVRDKQYRKVMDELAERWSNAGIDAEVVEVK